MIGDGCTSSGNMIGTSVQRYDIHEELGQGGMSVVYRGRDTTLDREVAVKVLHDHLAKEFENRERFRREAQAIARLQHPHILDVYDYSDEEDDQSYIVMEYIPGRNLRDFIDHHGHPPPEVAAMIGAVIADALEHAHEHGVIHRDLKPENLMVSNDGQLTLMDFGIAHVADAETMTQTGNLLGSPAHMAPEIIDGKDVNRRSDIFSLGTVLYWLSTGTFPFQGDNAPHLLRQVIECNFEDPEAVEPRLSRRLADIIGRCLRRDPEDRFESVSELRGELTDSIDILGDVDLGEELTSYFTDPEGYTREFESIIVDRLVERGREAMERGDIPEAIAHFNRVLGYEPDNEEVQRELEELDRQEIGVGQIALAVGIVLSAGLAVAYFALRPGAEPQSPGFENARAAVASSLEHATSAVFERGRDNIETRAVGIARHVTARSANIAATTRARTLASSTASTAPDVARAAPGFDRGESPVSSLDHRPSNDEPRIESTPPDATVESADEGGPDAGTPRTDVEPAAPETYAYEFKVLPLAATVYIDDRRFSAPEALNGIELERGMHRIRVESPGCERYESEFYVDGPREEKMSIVLEWKDAVVDVLSNRDAVVYLNGNKSRSFKIGAGGENSEIRIPFGTVDSNRNRSRKRLTIEVRPRDDMTLVRRQTLELRPGEQTSVNVNFPPER